MGLRTAFAEPLEEQALAAVQRGDLRALREVLGKQPDMRSRPMTEALAFALGNPDGTIAMELIEKGANLETKSGSPVWYRVLSSQNLDLLVWLLQRGILKTADESNGPGSVYVAASAFWAEGVKRLIAAGALPDVPDEDGNTALLKLAARSEWAAWQDEDLADAARALVSAGADPRRKNRQGLDAADVAWRAASLDLVQAVDADGRYFARHAEIRQQSLDRQLRASVLRHQIGRMRWLGQPSAPLLDLKAKISGLLSKGANAYALPLNPLRELTAFEVALGAGDQAVEPDPALVELLLRDFKPEAIPIGRVSPLVVAAHRPELVKRLLAVRVPTDGLFLETQMALLQLGRRAGAVNVPQEINVLHGVAMIGVPESLRLLVQAGVACDLATGNGRTPLHLAILNQRLDNAAALLELGADPTRKTQAGSDAVDLAADMVAISLLRGIDKSGRYRTLLNEFPAVASSPLVGRWTGYAGPGTFAYALVLRADGGGEFNGMELGWKADGDAVSFTAKRQTTPLNMAARPMTWAAEIDPLGDAMEFKFPGAGRRFRLRRGDEPFATPPRAIGPTANEVQFAHVRVQEHVGFSLEGPQTTTIPDELFSLVRCERLDIVGTKIAKLPGRLGELQCLTSLDVYGNELDEVEPGLARAAALTELHLQENRLTSLPPDIAALPRMEVLFVYGNQITALPEGWENSSALRNLAIGRNQIRELPDSIGRAPSLKWLQAENNRLTSLPDSLGSSPIENINVAGNRIATIPAVVGRIKTLQSIDLSHNPLAGNIDPLGDCSNLRVLRLASIGLERFPDFRRLPIRTLDLSDNVLGAWPTDQAALPATLEELVLRNCGLTEIPPWLLDLALSRLDLFGNKIPDEQARAATAKVRKNWDEKQRALRANGKGGR